MTYDAPVSVRSATGFAARSQSALPSARLATIAQQARGMIHLWFSPRQDNGQYAALFFKKAAYDLPDGFSRSWNGTWMRRMPIHTMRWWQQQ
jgi:hypothetical protein